MADPIDIAALRKLAEAARNEGPTPETWWGRPEWDEMRLVAPVAEYVSACSPQTILALLDALEAARRERDEASLCVRELHGSLSADFLTDRALNLAATPQARAREFMLKMEAIRSDLAAARAEAEALRAELAHFAPYFEAGARALCPDPTSERRRLDAARARWEKA